MRPIRRRHRNRSKHSVTTVYKHPSSLRMYTERRTEIVNVKVPFWSQTGRFPGKNDHTRRSFSPSRQSQRFLNET